MLSSFLSKSFPIVRENQRLVSRAKEKTSGELSGTFGIS